MKHLVLGSSGQIGGHLCKYLRDKGEEVIYFDIKMGEEYDLRLPQNHLLEKYVEECDFVHFLAYDVGGTKYLEKHQDTFGFIDNNMRIMSNVFSMLDVYKKPFIFASSQMSELTHSSYGQLKSLGEKITYDLGGVVARFWNVYGIEPQGEHSHVITDLCKMAKYDRCIKVRTDGEEKRQFIYADDVSDIMYGISTKNIHVPKTLVYGHRLDVTSGVWTSIKEIAYIVAGVAKLGTGDVYFSSKKDNTQKDAQNEAKQRGDLFNRSQISLEEGIKKIYEKI